jgi:DMSO reductase anchor subunit
MMLEFFRLLFDSGLLVLILMVQLIIYPSFLHYPLKSLITWHNIYTKRIAVIVVPLMLGQLSISLYQVYENQVFDTFLYAAIVLFLWAITLFKFAPMHTEISRGNVSEKFLEKLVRSNWIRTILWFLLFLLTVTKIVAGK